MTTVLVETSSALPLVTVSLSFRSGAVHDPPGKEGLSRVTCGMLRRGAEGWPKEQIEETIDALGGDFGADIATSSTSVSFEVIRRSLEPLTDLVATLLAKPLFAEDELGRLIRKMQADIVEARDEDRILVGRAFRRTLFDGHPYGRRASGTIGSLGGITTGDVAAFAKQHYTRNNAVVAIAGDITSAEADRVATALLAGLPEGVAIADSTPPPPAPQGRHLVLVDKPERTQCQMILGCLGTDIHDEDHVALLVANTVFGGPFTSRMMQEIRVKNGWSYGASSRVGFDRQRDAFLMWCSPAAKDAGACLRRCIELLEQWCKDGITDEELAFVKSYLIRSHAFEIDTPKKRVHQKLETALFDLPGDYHERWLDRVRAVTREEANRAIRNRITPEHLVLAVVGTQSEVAEPLKQAVTGLSRTTVVPFDIE